MDRAHGVWTLTLTAVLLAGTSAFAAGGPDEPLVVRNKVRIACPEINVGTGSGEPVQWIGRSSRGFLGVELTPLTPQLRSHFGVPGDAGVMIGRVVEDSAAAAAGLQVGDIVTRVDGKDVASASALGRAIRQKEGGEVVDLELWRDGELVTATATLGEQERCAFDVGSLGELDLERLQELGNAWSPEAMEAAREALRAVDWSSALEGLQGIDWEKQLEGLEELDLEGLEERMERVRERLERLERELERESERLERFGRDAERDRDGGGA